MSRTSGIFTESSDNNLERDLCRLCRKNHDCFYSIFTSNVACKITVKDALYDLVGLQITVGDGLPTTMCPPCLKKLTEFSVFKKICLESDAVLRKSCIRALEGGVEVDGPSGDLPEKLASYEEYDEEESLRLFLESSSDENNECRNSNAGTKVDADCDHMQAQASTSSQGEEVDAEGTRAIVIVQDSMLVLAKQESPKETDATEPTSMENGELIQKRATVMESMTDTVLDLPATKKKKNVRIVDGKSLTDSPHKAKRPYSCNECEKSFFCKSHLIIHIRTHTKEKPYSCGECEKSFSQKSNLNKHIRTHTKKKKNVRIVDGKSLTDSPHKAKTPYVCNECEKSFPWKCRLITHIRTHTKEKPYSCDECEKSYSYKSSLVSHIRTHTKKKP